MQTILARKYICKIFGYFQTFHVGNDVPRFVDQSIGTNQDGNQDVLNNLTEVRSSDRTRHTDRAIPRASRLELWLEPRPDDRFPRTEARLPRPTRHSKTHGRARLDLDRTRLDLYHARLDKDHARLDLDHACNIPELF